MAINKISEFPKVTPSADDKILIEKNGEGGSATLASLPISTAVETRLTNLTLNAGDSSAECADARVNADESITYPSLKARLDAEHSELKGELDYKPLFEAGYRALNGFQYGDLVVLSGYKSIIIPVQEGDVFRITGIGTSTARVWATADNTGGILRVASSDASLSDFELTIASGETMLICNGNANSVQNPFSVIQEKQRSLINDGVVKVSNKQNYDERFSDEPIKTAVENLKGFVDGYTTEFITFESGRFSTSGYSRDSRYARSKNFLKAGTYYFPELTGYTYSVFAYTSDSQGTIVIANRSTAKLETLTSDCILVIYKASSNITDSEIISLSNTYSSLLKKIPSNPTFDEIEASVYRIANNRGGRTVGSYISNTGSIETDATCDVSDYILVEPNAKVKINNVYLVGNRSIFGFDINKGLMYSLASQTSDTMVEITIPDHIHYIKVTSPTGVAPTAYYADTFPLKTAKVNEIHSVSADIPFTFTSGKSLDANGNEETNASYMVSNYIPVVGGKNFTLQMAWATGKMVCHFYDSNKVHIGGISYDTSAARVDSTTETLPVDCCYMRFTRSTSVTCTNTSHLFYNENVQYSEIPFADRLLRLIKDKTELTMRNPLEQAGRTAIVTFIDDDTEPNAIHLMKDLCDTKNVKCTFSCVASKLENMSTGETLKSTLLSYQAEGFHIANHSYSHGYWMYRDPTNIDWDAYNADIIHAIQVLQDAGFVDPRYLVTPGGIASEQAQNIARMHSMFCLVNSADKSANHLYEQGRYRIRRVLITANNALTTYTDLVDEALENGDWLVFETHSGYASWSADAVIIAGIMDYCASVSMPIKPLNEAFMIRKPCYDLYDVFR